METIKTDCADTLKDARASLASQKPMSILYTDVPDTVTLTGIVREIRETTNGWFEVDMCCVTRRR